MFFPEVVTSDNQTTFLIAWYAALDRKYGNGYIFVDNVKVGPQPFSAFKQPSKTSFPATFRLWFSSMGLPIL